MRYAVCVVRCFMLGLLPMAAAHPVQANCQADARGADAVVDAVLRYDAPALAALVDTDALASRVTRDLPEDDELRKVLPKSVAERIPQLMSMLLQSQKNAGMTLSRQHAPGKRAVVRKHTADMSGGLDYLEFHLTREGCIADWTSLMMGSEASGAMRQNIALMRRDDGLIGELFGLQRVDTQQLAQTRKLVDALVKADRAAALEALDGMKSVAQSSYALSMMKVGLLGLDPDAPAYRQALEDLSNRFGDDPRTQFILVDHYYFTGQYDKALKSIERMQKQVGKDEDNQMLKGSVLGMQGKIDEAVVALREMVELAPDRPEVHGVLVGFLAEQGRVSDAVAAMRNAARFDVSFPEQALRENEAFAPVLKSADYQAWRAEQAD